MSLAGAGRRSQAVVRGGVLSAAEGPVQIVRRLELFRYRIRMRSAASGATASAEIESLP